MKYFEVEFTITPCSQVAQDLLSALAGEAGFETFEETANGLKGYVQQTLFDESVLSSALEDFPLDDTHIIYKVEEAEDRDWNEQWEQEAFHDGRHLPSDFRSENLQPTDIEIEIDAHFAFGTGTHETTRMICATLLGMNLSGMKVLDCGCGTGILGICALKLGAQHCVGYDIDEWSVDNTRHNAVINRVDDRLESLHGDATMLSGFPAEFDLVMANINRNILLQDMERFVSIMRPRATLILSGFYQSDCQLLEEKANCLGLMLKQTKNDRDWACLVFQYQ